MKLKSLLIVLVALPTFLCAQEGSQKVSTIMSAGEQRAKISVQGGYYLANDYNKIVAGENIGIDMTYMLTGKISLTNHYNFGRNRYFENVKSENPLLGLQEDSTNANIYTIHVGICVGYTTPLSKEFTFSASTGISTYSETIMYPTLIFENYTILSAYKQETKTLIAVPLLASLNYLVNDNFEIGVAGGIYISPGESILGAHFGPQALFKF